MAYTVNNPQFGFSLFSQLFTYSNTSPLLLDLDRNWTQVWKVMNEINTGKSIGFNDDKGIYRRPLMKRQSVLANIASVTQKGANLVLTFTDPNYSGFRQKDYVKDDFMFEGRVVSADPNIGGVEIEPLYNPSGALVAGTNFAAGTNIRAYGDVSGNFNSGAKVPLYREISVQEDYSTVFRDGTQRARREKFKTHIGTDGIAYFYTNDEVEMVKRAFKLYGKTCMFGTGGTKSSPVEGQINGTRGIRQSIITDGNYFPATGVMTQADFESLFFSVANTDGDVEQHIEVWCGRRALATLQRFYTNLLQYTGVNSTLPGATKGSGENFMGYALANIHLRFRVMGCLNDGLEVPDWMQDSVYIMDVTPQPAMNENGQITKQSPLQMIHWSSNTNSENEMIYTVVPGTVTPGNSDNRPAVSANYLIAANSNDGYATDFVWDFGVSYVADKSALFEYIR